MQWSSIQFDWHLIDLYLFNLLPLGLLSFDECHNRIVVIHLHSYFVSLGKGPSLIYKTITTMLLVPTLVWLNVVS
jgi:hypothetical protein